MKKQQIFKDYTKSQLSLPMDLEVFIPDNHIVRVVDEVIDALDIDNILDKYEGGGSSSYHPKMLLKVIVYAYTQRIYSGRVIAKNLRENIYFMWLAAKNTPDFRTINRFRSERMKDETQIIFANLVLLLAEKGHFKFDNCYVDGTKIEANANKYSFVWAKSIIHYSKKLQDKVNALLASIDEFIESDERKYGDNDLAEVEATPVTREKLVEVAEKVNEALEENPKNKVLKKAKKDIEKDILPRMEKYENQQEILQERNSFSKTDNDATFMRMKEDHMRNGQLKPGYNVQISTENQFIINYSLHQTPGDTTTIIPHLNQMEKQLGILPTNIVADAGYGSEENYDFLKEKELGNYVKYNMFNYDMKNKRSGKKFGIKDFIYQKEYNRYICLNGEFLNFKETTKVKTSTGYIQEYNIYKCEFCGDCPMRDLCTESIQGRSLRVNSNLEEHKREVRENLNSEVGKVLGKRRGADVEPVFGMIKWNRKFKRFNLKGLSKVEVEWGLLSFAHNLMKLSTLPKNTAI